MVRLDVGCAVATAGFHNIRVEGALNEELDFLAGSTRLFDDLALSFSNVRMNFSPMILRFFSGSLTPFRAVRKSSEASTAMSLMPVASTNHA